MLSWHEGRLWDEVRSRRHAARVGHDVDGADRSGIVGTPTFFINGERYDGAHGTEPLFGALQRALTS